MGVLFQVDKRKQSGWVSIVVENENSVFFFFRSKEALNKGLYLQNLNGMAPLGSHAFNCGKA